MTSSISAGQCIAAGLATISIAGAGIGIGIIFGCYVVGVAFNPEQRYLNFLEKQPELLQRIPQYHIIHRVIHVKRTSK